MYPELLEIIFVTGGVLCWLLLKVLHCFFSSVFLYIVAETLGPDNLFNVSFNGGRGHHKQKWPLDFFSNGVDT